MALPAPVPLEALPAGVGPGTATWPALIEQIGAPGFLPTLLALCQELGGATDLALMHHAGGPSSPAGHTSTALAAPTLLGTASCRGNNAALAGGRYLRGAHYQHDPNLHGVHRLGGQLGLGQLSAHQLPDSDWRAACYDAVGLDERISLLVPAGPGWLILNTYRPLRAGVGHDTALAGLGGLAPGLAAAMRRHVALTTAPTTPAPATTAPDPLATLSSREREVVQAILAGHSAKQIGRALGLSPTSVATYRQRAFQKLGVRRQVELFRLLSAAR